MHVMFADQDVHLTGVVSAIVLMSKTFELKFTISNYSTDRIRIK